MAHQKGVRLENLCEKDTAIYSDQQMLETIIRNLVGNAIKFTPTGGSVTIRSKLLENAVEVSVSDTGVGIEGSVRDTLFSIDSDSRTVGTNGEKGSGFGLDLCNELVQRHNGHLRVESHINEGSTFRVILPFPKTEGIDP